MGKKALVITEVFYPEDFIINNLVDDWLDEGYELEILTRNPSYPYGKVFKGYKNSFYNKSLYKSAIIHRFFVISGYQSSLFIKLLNYLFYIFLSFWTLLFIGKRFDKVFIYQTGPLTNAFSAILLKKLFGYKITIWSQDLWPDTIYAYGLKKTKITHYFLTKLVKYIYKRCDHILVSCKGFKKIIDEIVPGKKIIWIPNWPIIDGFSETKKTLPGAFNFTFAGNIGKVQNLSNVVKAFKNIEKNYKEAYLNIIGDGSFLEELKDLAKNESVENINFTGRKPLEEMPEYFAGSDVLIISLVDAPIYEIMIPSKFQTYLTAKKPVFAIMKGEVENMVTAYNLGFSASPSSISEIETRFKKFINLSKFDMEILSKNSLKLLEESFSEVTIKKELNSIFWSSENK